MCFVGSSAKNVSDATTDNDLTKSPIGTLRLRQFSKSLTGANVANVPNPNPQSSLSFTEARTGKYYLSSMTENRNDRDNHREKMVGSSSFQMEQFEKRGQYDAANISFPSSSSSRPENEHFLNVLKRGESLHGRTNINSEEQPKSRSSEKQKEARDNLMKISCDYCEHFFSNDVDLNDHVGRFHAGVKKFVCFVCHKRFKRKQSLENHVLMIHGVPGSGVGSGITNAYESGNYNSGDGLPGRRVETNTRDQMIMLLIEKEKAELVASGKLGNGNTSDS